MLTRLAPRPLLFYQNQRQWQAKPLSRESIEGFKENCALYNFTPEQILPHDSYLINLGHPESEGLEKSRQAFLDELQRCQQLGLNTSTSIPAAICERSLKRLVSNEFVNL